MSGSLALAWRLARRELRAGVRGFAVFFACVALGVAAITTVGVINAGVHEGLERDAAMLLGGDLRVDSTNFPVEEAELAGLALDQARRSDVVRTNAMAYAGDGRRVVTELKAVDGAYPLYGEALLDPPMALDAALADGGAVVERGLLTRLGLELGDRMRIGEAQFELRAVLEREPDRLGGYISIGPRTVIALDRLAATGALLPGALARYSYRFALLDGLDPERELARLRAASRDARWQVQGTRDVEPRVTRFTDRLSTYLTLAGLTALLIGGIGVALAIRNYLAGKTATIATLKCLGAPSGLVFRIYLLQVLTLAGASVLLGLVLGHAAPFLLRLLPPALLPLQVVQGLYPAPLLIAAGCGLLTALAFTLWPLARARDTSPASMFRALTAPPRRPRRRDVLWLALTLGALAAVALLGVADRWLGLIFIGAAGATALVLAGLSRLILSAARHLGRRGPTAVRMAAANLNRPGAGASGVIVALGAGLAVLTMIALLERNLEAEIGLRLPARAPSLFFIDIQPHQAQEFRDLIAASAGTSLLQEAPLIRGRVVRIDGAAAEGVNVAPDVAWTVRRDRGLTYSAAMPGGTNLVAGGWWPEDYTGPPLVSIDQEVAEGYGVGIGDSVSFNVLGRVIDAEIASLREIDWAEARLNFVFVLSPGLLEAAPHTVVAAVEADEAIEAALLDQVAERLPNVTPIMVRELVAQVSEALGKVALAVSAVAGITVLAGILVLAGAVAAARRRHLYEAVVLKVLGATRQDLLRVFLLEYLGLGLAAALAGAALGTLAALAVVRWALDLPWVFAPGAVLEVVALALAVTVGAGFIGTWRLLGRPAAPVLRAP